MPCSPPTAPPPRRPGPGRPRGSKNIAPPKAPEVLPPGLTSPDVPTRIAARQALVAGNMGLVGATLKALWRYDSRVRRLGIEEAFAEGCVGLANAARCFDPTRKVRFSTYATHSIRHSIIRATSSNSGLVHVPPCAWHGQYVREAERAGKIAHMSWLGSDWRLLDHRQGADEIVEQRDAADLLDRLMTRLTEKEKDVVRWRMAGAKLAEMGQKLGVCKERARQVWVGAVRKIREAGERLGISGPDVNGEGE